MLKAQMKEEEKHYTRKEVEESYMRFKRIICPCTNLVVLHNSVINISFLTRKERR